MSKSTLFFLAFMMVLSPGCKHQSVDSADSLIDSAKLTNNDTTLVESAIVTRQTFMLETWCNGTLESGVRAIVPFEVQGNITKVDVQNGEWVTQGQVLALIDDYRQQQAMAQAEINLRQTQINYSDQLLLAGYSVQDTANLPLRVKSGAMLRSGLSQALLELNNAKRECKNTRITAPLSGRVAGLTARPFTPTTGYKNFCTLLNTREMRVQFDVLEHDAAIIKPGVVVEVYPVALPGRSFKGKISGADFMISSHGTLTATALIPNGKEILLDGMKVKVAVKTNVPDQIVIPKSAVLTRQNRQVVFTVENGHAIWNYVVTGYENSTHYTVTEGLKQGQKIIVSNNLTIGHQAPVLVSNQLK